ncbi:MAG TPA: hypothetical protein VF815_16835 [Myxococcaceae bacterium]
MPAGLGGEDAAELEALSSRSAYDTFLALAQAVEPRAVEECRADIALAYYNVRQGVDSVLGQESAVSGLPNVRLEELHALPQLAQGLAFAALQVHKDLRAADFGPLFEQALHSRRKLLKAAEALAVAELLAESDVEALLSSGRHDVIEDCVSLAALLKRNAARIAGRSPVTSEEVTEAEQLASRLRGMLSPQGSGPGSGPAPALVAAALRDRFWTLLNQRHEVLWRCGAWLFGRAVDDHVPPLQARHVRARKAPEPRSERGAARAAVSALPSGEARSLSSQDVARAGGPDPRKVRFMIRVGADLSKL